MEQFNNISSVYFLGIGGIGMSALARYFKNRDKKVSGYDKTKTVLTIQLESEGIAVHYEDDLMLMDKKADLVVYTPALPRDHNEYNYYLENGFNILKRSEVLGMITRDSFSICVAGTHGKTTTSAMIAHILRHSGFGCNAFLGGIASNYDTNFWGSENDVSVAEADEYDRSFLKLNPDIAVITSMDADHLDIYGTADKLQDAFIAFSAVIKPGGLLISKYELNRSAEFIASKKKEYSVDNNKADAVAENIEVKDGSYHFNISIDKKLIEGMVLNMGGTHNIENAVAAVAVAKQVGISDENIRTAVAAFKGVKRRFEYVIKTDQVVMIDDYAHHPEELKALISGARKLFPDKKCTLVFQPHLFSRTRDFADGFAEALDLADEVLLLPVYPARELPMDGVNSEMIAARMKLKNVKAIFPKQLMTEIEEINPKLLITAGAGDIDMLVEPLKKIITGKNYLIKAS